LSAVLVFSSFFMKTIVPLRMVAICSNVAFITYALLGLNYGVFGRVYPILVLHASLLPLNLVRLRQLKALQGAVREATEDETIRSLVPYCMWRHTLPVRSCSGRATRQTGSTSFSTAT
jgi:CRP/FNR family cyclic AMP-dependent transcriptional regulator